MSFLACRVHDSGARIESLDLAELSPGEVVIAAEHSGINYKDALAVTGRGKILRRLPLIAGIDVAGTVESSADPRYRPGDAVLVNGMGLGESHDGGFAQRVRVPGDWIVPLPAGLSAFEAMILGTAGFTAALALQRMEQNGQTPALGPVAVTGASGGVGSVAVSLLASQGYEVVAVSGRPEYRDYLKNLGASQVLTPEQLELGSRPLESVRFGGVVDNVGGSLLAGLMRHVQLWGNVASIGMAGGHAFEASVFPHILRGVSLLGISSANCPMPLRAAVWQRLGQEWKPPQLPSLVHRRIPLAELIPACTELLDRHSHGRTVIDLA